MTDQIESRAEEISEIRSSSNRLDKRYLQPPTLIQFSCHENEKAHTSVIATLGCYGFAI